MIIKFPEPITLFELLYSILSRYRKVMNDATKWVYEDVFGSAVTKVNWLFPTRLMAVARNIPGQPFTAEEIMLRFTAFPIVKCFVSEADLERIRNYMLGEGTEKEKVTQICGFMQYLWSDKMRYCEECHREEKKMYRESAWHLMHQLHPILVCAKHRRPLVETSLDRSLTQGTKKRLLTPDESGPIKAIEIDVEFLENQCQMASFLEELVINLSKEDIAQNQLVQNLQYELKIRGIITPMGKIMISKIKQAIINNFGSGYVAKYLAVGQTNQVETILRNFLVGKARLLNPVLVACIAISFSIKSSDLVRKDTKVEPIDYFEKCHNPFCPHFGQSIIGEWWKSKKSPHQIFRCSYCGYAYSLYDNCYIYEYGNVFEEEIVRLYNDGQSFNAISRLAKISVCTVQRILARKGLYKGLLDDKCVEVKRIEMRGRIEAVLEKHPGITRSQLRELDGSAYSWTRNFDREWLDKRLQQQGAGVFQPVYRKQAKKDVLDSNRATILLEIEANPSLRRCDMTGKVAAAMRWCRKHDKEWLDKTLPPIHEFEKFCKSGLILNPDFILEFDADLARQVKAIVEASLNEVGKPFRITRAFLVRSLNTTALARKSALKRLPLTQAALNECMESIPHFQIRRLEYWIRTMKSSGEPINRTRLLVKAGITGNRINSEIEAYLSSKPEWFV